MPLAILHWRALIIRDIILSGFELDLYTDEERVFAYWYLSKALGVHESNVRELLGIVPECESCCYGKMKPLILTITSHFDTATPAHKYLATQLDHILLLRDMSLGCFQVRSLQPPFSFFYAHQSYLHILHSSSQAPLNLIQSAVGRTSQSVINGSYQIPM